MDNKPPEKHGGWLRMRLDQIFSEVRATLSPEILHFIPENRSAYLNKLTEECGLDIEVDDEGNIAMRGSLDEIILAKIKLEKVIVVDDQSVESSTNINRPSSRCSDGPQPKTFIRNGSFSVNDGDQESQTPTRSLLMSRRKRGRPRKVQPISLSDLENTLYADRASGSEKSEETVMENNETDVNGDASTSNNCNGNGSGTDANKQIGIFNDTNEDTRQKETTAFGSYLQRMCDDMASAATPQTKSPESFSFNCKLCTFKAEKEAQLLKHVLIHGKSTGKSLHRCDKCSFASVSVNHYQRHRVHAHTDSFTLLQCPQCPFETDDGKLLSRHFALRHSLHLDVGESTSLSDTKVQQQLGRSSVLQCNECPYNTTKIYHFERHLLVHNGDLKALLQMYHCDECDYRTHRKEHYMRHKEKVHAKNLHTCGVCNYTSKTVDKLKKHLATQHDVPVGDILGSSIADAADFSEQLASCLDVKMTVPYYNTTGNDVNSNASVRIKTEVNEEDAQMVDVD